MSSQINGVPRAIGLAAVAERTFGAAHLCPSVSIRGFHFRMLESLSIPTRWPVGFVLNSTRTNVYVVGHSTQICELSLDSPEKLPRRDVVRIEVRSLH